jgi:predicted TIM-barrel fold metal-dependent hydrolase
MVTSSLVLPKSGLAIDPRPDWLALHSEEIIEPERTIVDAHHHLWDRRGDRYLLDEFTDDLGTGHNVVATVFVDCRSMYRAHGPDVMRPIGEVEFANGIAAQSASGGYGQSAVCAAIVSHANLLIGSQVRPVLEAQIKAGNGRFRGIRYSAASDVDRGVISAHASRPKGIMFETLFREGFGCLAPLGLTFDAWVFHTQIRELADLARAFPDTKIVLNHIGGPIAIGSYSNRRDEIFADWSASIKDVAKCSNVMIKLGGLATKLAGFDFHTGARPPTSEQLARAWGPYIETCIEAFGPTRSMFESNFPADKGTCSYQVIWNTFKRVVSTYTEPEKNSLFSGAASDFYSLAVT